MWSQVSRLQEQLQAERDLRAALEVGLSMSSGQVSGSRTMDSKVYTLLTFCSFIKQNFKNLCSFSCNKTFFKYRQELSWRRLLLLKLMWQDWSRKLQNCIINLINNANITMALSLTLLIDTNMFITIILNSECFSIFSNEGVRSRIQWL